MVLNDKYLLLFGIALFLIVNTYTLKDGHNLGSDFSRYIRHSKNIVENRDYSYGLPVFYKDYPPGFPLIIAPIIRFFGVNFILLKSVNILFWLFFTLIFFKITSELLDNEIAVLGSLVLLSSPWFFIYKQELLSDLPFLAFSMVFVYSIQKYFSCGYCISQSSMSVFDVCA